jgi:hypothetical protein
VRGPGPGHPALYNLPPASLDLPRIPNGRRGLPCRANRPDTNSTKRSFMKALNRISLIAPCGMNCGLCMAYLREKDTCPGCRAADTRKKVSVIRCKIKNCGPMQKDSLKYCFGCDNFPCKNLRHLDTRYRTRYHISMIENLLTIKNLGIRRFLKKEKIRWTCPACGGTVCVHKGKCRDCGGSL